MSFRFAEQKGRTLLQTGTKWPGDNFPDFFSERTENGVLLTIESLAALCQWLTKGCSYKDACTTVLLALFVSK